MLFVQRAHELARIAGQSLRRSRRRRRLPCGPQAGSGAPPSTAGGLGRERAGGVHAAANGINRGAAKTSNSSQAVRPSGLRDLAMIEPVLLLGRGSGR